jgi:hypothetical protein
MSRIACKQAIRNAYRPSLYELYKNPLGLNQADNK